MTTSDRFIMSRDINGFNGFGLAPSNYQYGVDLAQDAGQTLCTVPSNYKRWIAIFAIDPGLRVFVRLNGTAEEFSGTAGVVTSELNPMAWEVEGGDTISVITPDTDSFVGVKLYAISA